MSIDRFVEKYTVALKDKFVKLEYYNNSKQVSEKKYIKGNLYYCKIYNINDVQDLTVRDTYNDLKQFYSDMFDKERNR